MRRTLFFLMLFLVAGIPAGASASSPQEIRIDARERLEKNPNDFRALFNLGYASYLQKDYEKALKQFRNALPHANGRVERSAVRYNMGNACFMQKKIKEAIKEYRTGLRLNPEDRQLQYNYTVAKLLQQAKNQSKNNKNKKNNKQKQGKSGKNKPDNKNGNKDGKSGQDKQKQQKNGAGKRRMSKEDARRILEALKQREGKRMKARQLKKTGRYNPDSKQW